MIRGCDPRSSSEALPLKFAEPRCPIEEASRHISVLNLEIPIQPLSFISAELAKYGIMM